MYIIFFSNINRCRIRECTSTSHTCIAACRLRIYSWKWIRTKMIHLRKRRAEIFAGSPRIFMHKIIRQLKEIVNVSLEEHEEKSVRGKKRYDTYGRSSPLINVRWATHIRNDYTMVKESSYDCNVHSSYIDFMISCSDLFSPCGRRSIQCHRLYTVEYRLGINEDFIFVLLVSYFSTMCRMTIVLCRARV